MRRRDFLTGSLATFGARAVRATEPNRVYRLATCKFSPWFWSRLLGSLRQLGYVEGRNIIIEGRFAHGKLDRVPELAAELVGLDVDVIASLGAVGAQAARKVSTKIPIVFVGAIDPVALGFAATLERPGGNVTGITSFDPQQATKQFEILKKVIPQLDRVAIMSDEDIPRVDGWNPLEKANDTAARALGWGSPVSARGCRRSPATR